jgi:hypothetical protein
LRPPLMSNVRRRNHMPRLPASHLVILCSAALNGPTPLFAQSHAPAYVLSCPERASEVPAPPCAKAPPAPIAPTAFPELPRVNASSICPNRSEPKFPRAGFAYEGTNVVEARFKVERGAVSQIVSLSGPSAFHSSVREAIMQYRCKELSEPVIAVQRFTFKVEAVPSLAASNPP